MIKETVSLTKEFHPFPAYTDRQGWEAVREDAKEFYNARGKELLGFEWPALSAALYLEYYRNGNRSRFEDRYFERRRNVFFLMMAECIAGSGEYLDDIINGVWAISEESTWVVPAHNNTYRDGISGRVNELPNLETDRYVDIIAAETGSLLSWVYYFLGDALAARAPLVKRRIELEVERRILLPFLKHHDWNWMGLDNDRPVNNWNSWINSNLLVCSLVFSKTFPLVREAVEKTIRSINRFIHFYADDGGCDEGPGYFSAAGASLLDFIEELGYVTDVSCLYGDTKIRNMAAYIYKVYIGKDFFVNYADASPRVSIPSRLLSRTGKRIGDDTLWGFSAYAVEHKFCHEENEIVHPNRVYRQIADCFAEIDKTCPPFRAPEQSWFPGIQVVTAHEGSAEDGLDGLFFSAKGGHNAESHNHNDVGNFILYYHAVPVIIDPGSESYTKITFSEKRYTLWYTQSCYHNVPAINGMDQAPGFEHRAKDVSFSHDGNSTRFSLELAEVYFAEAGIKSYRRDFVFRKGEGLLLTDTWSLKEGGAPVELNLMCYEKPEIDREQVLLSGCVSLSFDPSLFALTVDTVPLADKKMCRDWDKDVLFRLRLAGKDSGPSGTARLRFTGL